MRIEYKDVAEADQADALLGLSPKRSVEPDGRVRQRLRLIDPIDIYKFETEAKDVTRVPIWLRSFFNQLFYAARSIELPPGGIDRTRIYRDAEGKPLDPRPSLMDILDIRSSPTTPDNASVAVKHRGHWFYISDLDRQSKDTFNLLSVVFALQSDVEKTSPVLTIPVGG